jgi:aminoglycoside phosphotransferase (APT) family kinase protein
MMPKTKEKPQSKLHEQAVKRIVLHHFGKEPEKIEKMDVGLDNEVYSIQVGSNEYILRLNSRDSLKGSSKFIPLFKSKGIKVPDIIAEDYSKKVVPYNWQIMTKIKGRDLGRIISSLTEEQLRDIAKEIAMIAKKLLTIPTNGKFGYVGVTEEKLKPSLNEVVQEMLDDIKERNEKTGVVKDEYIQIFEKLLKEYESYFRQAPSQFYFDDMNYKNVMIQNGKFNGLVDLDGVSYGDFLEGIGRIMANWYGTKHGDFYTKEVMDNLGLNKDQRKIVTMWALLNRIYWQSEIGIQFNANTSTKIDSKLVDEGNARIDNLIMALKLSPLR